MRRGELRRRVTRRYETSPGKERGRRKRGEEKRKEKEKEKEKRREERAETSWIFKGGGHSACLYYGALVTIVPGEGRGPRTFF